VQADSGVHRAHDNEGWRAGSAPGIPCVKGCYTPEEEYSEPQGLIKGVAPDNTGDGHCLVTGQGMGAVPRWLSLGSSREQQAFCGFRLIKPREAPCFEYGPDFKWLPGYKWDRCEDLATLEFFHVQNDSKLLTCALELPEASRFSLLQESLLNVPGLISVDAY